MFGQLARESRLRQQDREARVLEHEVEPLLRVGRVEGHVGPARLEDSEHAGQHLRQPLHADSDQRFRPRPESAQMTRQLVGAGIKPRVCQTLSLEDGGHRLRGALHLLFKKTVDVLSFVVGPCFVQSEEKPLPFVGVQNLQRADCGPRPLAGASQQRQELPAQARDLRVPEEAQVVLKLQAQRLLSVNSQDSDLEAAGADLLLTQREGEGRVGILPALLFEAEADGGERRRGRVARSLPHVFPREVVPPLG